MSYDIVIETVPRFKSRLGDRVIEGSHNAVIVLGADRQTDVETGYGYAGSSARGAGAGAIQMIVGRAGPDPDPKADKSYLYLSMRSQVDSAFGTTKPGEAADGPAAVVCSDHVRVVARKDLKIVVGSASVLVKSDGSIEIAGDVRIGDETAQRLVKASFLTQYLSHGHPFAGPSGVTGAPVQQFAPEQFSTQRTRSK